MFNDAAYAIRPFQAFIPQGVTNALYFPQRDRGVNVLLKVAANANNHVFLFQAGTHGTTVSPAAIGALFTSKLYYNFSNNEVLSIDGPAPFYIGTDGVTYTVDVIIGLSPHND